MFLYVVFSFIFTIYFPLEIMETSRAEPAEKTAKGLYLHEKWEELEKGSSEHLLRFSPSAVGERYTLHIAFQRCRVRI
jgi:hypothetical protein